MRIPSRRFQIKIQNIHKIISILFFTHKNIQYTAESCDTSQIYMIYESEGNGKGDLFFICTKRTLFKNSIKLAILFLVKEKNKKMMMMKKNPKKKIAPD